MKRNFIIVDPKKLKKGDILMCNSDSLTNFTRNKEYVIEDFYEHNYGVVLTNDVGDKSEICNSNVCSDFILITDSASNNVNHPSHYTQGSIECIDAMESAYGTEAVIMFCMCNAFKYQWRFNKKNGREDILKCQWYQNKMVELQNKLNNKNKDV